MKREDVKQKIPGITDEQLDWLMGENGKDVTAEKTKAANLQSQLDTANAQLKTAQDGLEKFKGVNVDEMKNQLAKLQADMKAQADAFAFDNALGAAIRAAKGRSEKAIRGMLDLESLRKSSNRDTDIKAALEALTKSDAWAFDTAQASGMQTGNGQQQTGSGTASSGAEHGNSTPAQSKEDEMMAALFGTVKN